MNDNKASWKFEDKVDEFISGLIPHNMSNGMTNHISLAHRKLTDWADNSPAIQILSEELFKSHGVALENNPFNIIPSLGVIGFIFISSALKYENSQFLVSSRREMKHTPLAGDDYVEEAKGMIIEYIIDFFDEIKERLDDGTITLSEGEPPYEDDV